MSIKMEMMVDALEKDLAGQAVVIEELRLRIVELEKLLAQLSRATSKKVA